MKFYIKQKVFSLKDNFKVMNESGKEVYQVHGKFFSIHNKLELLNIDGSQVYNAQRKVLSIFPKYTLFTPHGDNVAFVQRKFGIKPKFQVEVGNREYKVEGSFFAFSFGIFDGDQEVASIQKKVISWGDAYEIEISSGLDTELFLFLVIIIDQVLHEKKN